MNIVPNTDQCILFDQWDVLISGRMQDNLNTFIRDDFCHKLRIQNRA